MTGLARKLTTVDAVVIGVGAMWGAGIFVALAPASAAARDLVLLSLALAALVAFANAASSAQLAATYPNAGGTYVYAGRELGPWWGYLAGWCFVIGKTASCAAMALTASAYLAGDGPWMRPVAATIVAAVVLINYLGITKTSLASKIIVAAVALVLILVIAAGFSAGHYTGGSGLRGDAWGVLTGAAFLFFAFAGYARVATLGEEVRNPSRTIPRAILLALGISLVTYVLVALALLTVATPGKIGRALAPLTLVVGPSGWYWLEPVIRLGAGLAAIGALLALIAGVGRTTFAMSREGDLPSWLSKVHPRFQVPHRAELAQGAIVIAIVALGDVRGAIGYSSFGVLVYYALANASALRQRHGRMFPRALQIFGLAGCLTLACALPLSSVLGGLVLIGGGVIVRLIWGAVSPRRR